MRKFMSTSIWRQTRNPLCFWNSLVSYTDCPLNEGSPFWVKLDFASLCKGNSLLPSCRSIRRRHQWTVFYLMAAQVKRSKTGVGGHENFSSMCYRQPRLQILVQVHGKKWLSWNGSESTTNSKRNTHLFSKVYLVPFNKPSTMLYISVAGILMISKFKGYEQ